MGRPGAEQAGVGERPPLAGEAGGQEQALVVVYVNADPHRLARRPHGEAVAQSHVHERRDVEPLGRGLAHHGAVAGLARDHIAVALAEGVGHLVDYGRQPAVGPVAKVKAERVEAVAEHPRHAQEPDRTACLDSRPDQQPADLLLERGGRAVAVVGLPEAHQAEAAAGEEAQPRAGGLQAVEVQQQHEHPVAQGMPARPQARVAHHADIERGRDHAASA